MGVRALQTYLERYCPSAIPIESIEELAEKRRAYTDQELIIVVDGLNSVFHMYTDLPRIGGAQLKEYVEKVKVFVQSFQKIGIRLVFFFDGTTVKKKRNTWVDRRMDSMVACHQLFDLLNEGVPTDNVEVSKVIPSGVCRQTILILETICNCEVVQSVFECDEEIAEYARRNNAFGVLGHDSDFVIYDIGRAFYFDSDHLDLQMMRTRVYYPEELALSLGLNKFQLYLLATLMGNDFVNYHDLRKFHYKLTQEKFRDVKYLVPKITSYIQSLHVDYLQRKVLTEVARYVFNNTFRAKDIEDSVTSYYLLDRLGEEHNNQARDKKEGVRWRATERDHISQSSRESGRWEERGESWSWTDRRREENWREDSRENWRAACTDSRRKEENDDWLQLVREVRQLHSNNKLPYTIYAIMKRMTFESCGLLEDYRISPRDLPLFAKLTLDLRQRLYGILLQQKPKSPGSHEVEEWCMAGPGSLDRAYYNIAVTPSVIHPGLLALWSDEDRPLGRLSDIRWTLFVHSVSTHVDVKKVQSLPSHLVMPTLILNHIVNYKGPGRLEEWEAEVFLATAAVLHHYGPQELAKISPHPLIVRGIRVSSLLMHTSDIIYQLQAACGYPLSFRETAAWHFFDGKLFQLKYKEANQCRISHAQLCDNKDDSLQAFQQARSVIFGESLAKEDAKAASFI